MLFPHGGLTKTTIVETLKGVLSVSRRAGAEQMCGPRQTADRSAQAFLRRLFSGMFSENAKQFAGS
jgi:hypothetical protein